MQRRADEGKILPTPKTATMARAGGSAPVYVDLRTPSPPVEAEGGEEDNDEGDGDSSEASDSSRVEVSDGSDSESDDGDLDDDYDYEDGEDGDDDDDDADDEEEEEEEESGVSRRKKRRMGSISSGDEGDVGEEDLYHKVVTMLQGRKDLNILKLDECKAYLRKRGLRLSGSKSVCIQRVREHWRLRDGNGEKLYPRSSFQINCTGDVCTGDAILFNQRVYDKYDIVTRGGNIIGRRTVAGKVVKESYGAAKKQHTFTVEILWSKGVKPLPALYPLLVKGRNLYRLKTFRQPWDNEMERSKVLAEKHKRGAAARHSRKIEKAKSVMRGPKQLHGRRGLATNRKKKEAKRKNTKEMHKKHVSSGRNIAKPRALESAARHSLHEHDTNKGRRNNLLPYIHCDSQPECHHRDSRTAFHANRGLLHSSTYEASSSLAMSAQVYNQALDRTSFFNHPCSNHHLHFGPNSSSLLLNQGHSEESFRFLPGMHLDRWKGGLYYCNAPGCQELATDGCVLSCCWMCCRRSGRRCDRHMHSYYS